MTNDELNGYGRSVLKITSVLGFVLAPVAVVAGLVLAFVKRDVDTKHAKRPKWVTLAVAFAVALAMLAVGFVGRWALRSDSGLARSYRMAQAFL